MGGIHATCNWRIDEFKDFRVIMTFIFDRICCRCGIPGVDGVEYQSAGEFRWRRFYGDVVGNGLIGIDCIVVFPCSAEFETKQLIQV